MMLTNKPDEELYMYKPEEFNVVFPELNDAKFDEIMEDNIKAIYDFWYRLLKQSVIKCYQIQLLLGTESFLLCIEFREPFTVVQGYKTKAIRFVINENHKVIVEYENALRSRLG